MTKAICKLCETSRRDSTRLDFVATITTQERSNRWRNPTTYVINHSTRKIKQREKSNDIREQSHDRYQQGKMGRTAITDVR